MYEFFSAKILVFAQIEFFKSNKNNDALNQQITPHIATS